MTPYAKISLGKNDWFWADGFLRSVSVTLAEGENSNSCDIELYDPGRKLIDHFLEYVESVQGLEPLNLPQSNTQSQGSTGGKTATGTASVNVKAFLDVLGELESGQRYNVLNGGKTFSSFAQHPGGTAGRYQIQLPTWNSIKSAEGLTDFTPQSQDKAAIALIRNRGYLAEIEAGNIEAAIDGNGQHANGLAYEWSVLPTSSDSTGQYGQAKLSMAQIRQKFDGYVRGYAPDAQSQDAAIASVQPPPVVSSERGKNLKDSAIKIGLGFDGLIVAEYEFLHTSIDFSMSGVNVLRLGGQATSWVLTQRIKNSAYQNVTFKQVAQKICDAYKLTLDMPNDGPTYVYFPQRGLSDYDMLLIEARRIGYRVTTKDRTLSIKPRGDVNAFTLEYADNLGMTLDVKHSAQSDSGGARSSDPNARASTGVRKVVVDPATGQHVPVEPENLVGTGEADKADKFTTGAAVPLPAPVTTGATDAADAARKANEGRVKGILANWSAPTSPELLLVSPDDAVRTKGVSDRIDRVWVLETITHGFGLNGAESTGNLYSPMRQRYETLQATGLSTTTAGLPPLNSGGFIKPTTGVMTSGFRTARRPRHAGVDIAGSRGTPVWSAADGTVTDVVNSCNEGNRSCGGRYGNRVYVATSGGFVCEYGHMSKDIQVSVGQQVKQGQTLGYQANSGDSSGIHLHWTIRLNGTAVNPANYVSL